MANNVAPSQVLLLGTEVGDGTVTGVTAGTSQPIPCSGYGIDTVYLRSIGTTTGGTILIEEADWLPSETVYSGTWSQIASIAASSFTGGAQTGQHVSNAAYGFFRVRISSAITGGGSVLVTLRRQGAGS